MPATKILIVEDDDLIAEDIATKLLKAGYEVTDIVDNCEFAIKSVRENLPDLAFLDIEIIGNRDGIETAKELKEIEDFPIIFLTDFYDDKTLKKALAVKPASYMNKPFTEHQLHVSIQTALYNTAEEKEATFENVGKTDLPEGLSIKNTLYLKNDDGAFLKYEIADILYIEADRAYCHVHTSKGKLTQSINMKAMGEKINNPKLVRAHRSYIINIDAIDEIKGNGNLLIINKQEIPVSEQYKDDILKRLQLVK